MRCCAPLRKVPMGCIGSLFVALMLTGCHPQPAVKPVVIMGPIVDTPQHAAPKRPGPPVDLLQPDPNSAQVREQYRAIDEKIKDLEKRLAPASADSQ
jgi:hypothetical protein